jgi:hypothetical protein
MTRIIFIGLLALLVSQTVEAQGPDTPEARRRQAERYVQVMNPREFLRDFFEKATANLPAAQREDQRAKLARIDVDAVSKVMVDVMAKCLTTEELKALADFYGSPVGRSAMGKVNSCMIELIPTIRTEAARQRQNLTIRSHIEDLTSRCSQPLHRVLPQFCMINARSLQSSLAVISGG